jgi:prolipoprotein diacylglyceryltransferase
MALRLGNKPVNGRLCGLPALDERMLRNAGFIGDKGRNAVIAIPSGIIVSRLLHVLDNFSYYIQNPGQIIGAAGLTIYGAVLGAALGIWIYSKFSSDSAICLSKR